MGDGERQIARPAAHVDDDRRTGHVVEDIDRSAAEDFGFASRDKNSRRQFKIDTHEVAGRASASVGCFIGKIALFRHLLALRFVAVNPHYQCQVNKKGIASLILSATRFGK